MFMDTVDLNRKEGETELAYIWRLGGLKNNGIIDMTWEGLTEILNRNLRESEEDWLGSSAYRKKYSLMKQAQEEIFCHGMPEEIAEIREAQHELYKERVKLADERRELNATLRAKAREETFTEHIERILMEHEYMPVPPLPYITKEGINGSVDLLISLTDLHAGININNTWNYFNYDVLSDRLFAYAYQVKEIAKRHNAENAYVVGSEFISGAIHWITRLESNDNVIEQFIKCMNIVVNFLLQITSAFNEVHFYVAPGNHSRIFPKKDENRKAENLDHLAIHYLRGYLQNIENIYFHENEVDEGIARFEIRGNDVVAVHGDKDSPENVCRHITELTGKIPDIILIGHRHTNALISANGGCKIVQSGCVSGMDNYATDLRLKGRPEQAVCVIDKTGLRCMYDVALATNK